jgi:predicted nucleic acid-binding protein
MPPTRVIPDSSFYICFLDDIGRVDALILLVTSRHHSFVMGSVIRREVTAKECPEDFLDTLTRDIEIFDYYDHAEILRPFFGDEEMRKGETEAVVISFILHATGEQHVLVIDESPARRFVERRFPDLMEYLTGTVGFLEASTVVRNIFTPEEAIEMMRAMIASGFRVDPGMVREAIGRLEVIRVG